MPLRCLHRPKRYNSIAYLTHSDDGIESENDQQMAYYIASKGNLIILLRARFPGHSPLIIFYFFQIYLYISRVFV